MVANLIPYQLFHVLTRQQERLRSLLPYSAPPELREAVVRYAGAHKTMLEAAEERLQIGGSDPQLSLEPAVESEWRELLSSFEEMKIVVFQAAVNSRV